VFHRFEDFDLPFFVCPVSFLTRNGRGERERWRREMGVLKRRGERESRRGELYMKKRRKRLGKKRERREKRGMCYFRIKIMHIVATYYPLV
jgi:hypothetical protein